MRKILKSNRGSSFIYVLVVLLILTILTASLITATVTNYQLGLVTGGRNTSFYLNDGAIEEVLAEIEELSHRAEVAASEIIQADTPEFKNKKEWTKFELWLERKMKLDDTDPNFISQEEASAFYEKALRKEFDKQFLLYLLADAQVEDGNDYTLINDEDEFVYENDFEITQSGTNGLSTSVLRDLETVTFNPQDFESFTEVTKPTLVVTSNYLPDTKEIKLLIQSDGTYNIYNKQIELAVRMIPPVYDYTTVTTLKRQQLYKNDILNNALTASNDILVTGGKVKTIGDVYAKGTFPEVQRIYSHQKGGVVIGYEQIANDFLDTETSIPLSVNDIIGKGTLAVTGNIKSGASVKLQHNGSTLSVNKINSDDNKEKSSIFADSFIVMNDSEKTTTTVDTHMLLLDDLFINSSNTSITIGQRKNTQEDDLSEKQGYFMAFFDGMDMAASSAPMNPDLSSSIRINKRVEKCSITLNNLFIPGVAYINIFRNTNEGRKYFQTGESMTTEKNFYFYQNQLSDQELRTKEFKYNDDLNNDYNIYEYVDEDGNIKDSVQFKVDHFITTVRDANDDGNMDIISSEDKSIIKLRDKTVDEILAENYGLGVFLSNDKIFNPSGLALSSGEFDSTYRLEFGKHIDLAMNLLGMRNYIDSKNIVSIDKNDSTSLSFMDTFIDYSKDATFDNINRDNHLVVLNGDKDKDIYINYPSTFTIPAGAIHVNNVSDLSAVVATKGNIFVYNEELSKPLNITGTLISDQSIIFYGPGEKVITQSDETIYGTIAPYDLLVDAFHVRDGRKLVTKYVNGTTIPDDANKPDDGLSRGYQFNLDMTIVNIGDSVDVNILSNPQLDGSSKEKSVKGYIVDYWREF